MASGARFLKWGFGLFLFGVFLMFGILGHYYSGARWPTGELFMKNITLWWACPWTLSVAVIQAGGLGMVALGLTRAVAGGSLPRSEVAPESSIALYLCNLGLLGIFAVGYAGYFAFDAMWPGFYYTPVSAGKNAWLLGQGLCIVAYFAGAVVAFNATRHAVDRASSA